MITKLATFRGVSPQGEPLVRLFEPTPRFIKEAGPIMPQIREWMSSYKPDENQIAILVNALGSSEYWGQNVNGDIFPETALLHDCRNHASIGHPVDDFTGKVLPPYGYWTFLNAHPFMHHRNKDPARAFGRVAFACWNPKMHRVELIVILDKRKAMLHGAQGVIDRILAGEYPDVSMGCRVPYDVCTICNNKSKTRNDYCACVKQIGMGKILDDGRRIGVINYHPRFFDISFVFIGADKTAKVMCKLGSIWVPASVAEAYEVYNIPEDSNGLVKAACAKRTCTECSGGCKVASIWGDVATGGLAGGTGGAVGAGLVDLATRRKLDARLLKAVGRAAAEWGTAGGVTGGIMSHLKAKQGAFQKAAAIKNPLVRRVVSSATARALRESEDGFLERVDPQETPVNMGISDGALRTNMQGSADDESMGDSSQMKQADVEILKAAQVLSALSLAGKRGGGTASGVETRHTKFKVTETLGVRTGGREYTLAVAENKKLGAKHYLVADPKTGEALGYTTVAKVPELGPGYLRLRGHYVEPKSRRKGIGTALLNITSSLNPDKTLVAVPDPFKDRSVSKKDLQSVYGRSGFLDMGGGLMMRPSWDLVMGAKSSMQAGLKKSAAAWKIGPPPMPNREKYPFVGTINFRGLEIGVENAPGTWRTGKGWKTLMKVPYGEFLHGKAGGTDGDKLDVFVGPVRNAQNVYIVHQNFVRGPQKGQYDEDKVMLGFDTPAQAKKAFLAHYDSDKYFRSMTTMAFPLFKRALVGGEVDGEKVAAEYDDEGHGHIFPRSDGTTMRCTGPRRCSRCKEDKARRDAGLGPRSKEKAANLMGYWDALKSEHDDMRIEDAFGAGKEKQAAELEDLFSGASKAERRERTWRDKVTNKEETVKGSGLNKTASLHTVNPAVIKIAKVLRDGWSASDLLKVSNAMKAASHLKWAEIVKRIGPSKAVGRVTPLLSQTEETLPKELLDEMGQQPELEKSLATPSLMGMVLKPEEFQRILLTHMGKGPLADKLDDAGAVFKPSDDEACPCPELSPEQMDPKLMESLLPHMEGKSYVGPVVRRRITRVTVSEPEPEEPPTEVDSPLLSKVSSAYTWYRREQMKLASALPATITSHPELHAGVYGLGLEDAFSKTATSKVPSLPTSLNLDKKSIAVVLGTVPLTLMYSAHKRGQRSGGKDIGLLGNLIADHPWLTSMGVVTGLGALLRNPKAQQAVDEVFAAGKRVWEGKRPAAAAQSHPVTL